MQNYLKQFGAQKLIVACILALLAITVGMILWTTNKGIDLSDEGLSLVLADPWIANFNSVIRYDIIFKLIYRITHLEFGIIELRILRLLGIATILYFTFKNKLFATSAIDKVLIALSLIAGYTILTESLSYYTLILLFSFFYFYCFLKFVNKGGTISSILAGIFIAFCFVVKPPSAVLLYGLTGALLVLISIYKKNLLVLKYGALSLLGSVIIFLLLNWIFPDFSPQGVIKSAMELANSDNGNYKKSSIIFTFISSVKWVLLLLGSGCLAAVSWRKRRTNLLVAALTILLSIVIIAYFFYKHYDSNEFDLPKYCVMVITPLILGLIFTLGDFREWTIERKAIGVALFFAPFFCQFGSNVYFFRGGVNYLLFWVLLILLIKDNKEIRIAKSFYGLALSILVFQGVYNNLIQNPIKQPAITEATVKYIYNKNHSIYLNPKQVLYLNQLKEVFQKNSNADNQKYVIGMYCLPGHIAMTDMKVFYNPFIWNKQQLKYFVNKAKSNPEFSSIKPLLLSKKKAIENDVQDLYNVKLLDSVRYIDNGYVYIFQTE